MGAHHQAETSTLLETGAGWTFYYISAFLSVAYGKSVERICGLEPVTVTHGDRPQGVDGGRYLSRKR
jgi:hypothetical protein